MNWKKWFGATLLLATFVASTDNASADEQGEADFRALRKKVNLLRASEPAAVQKLIAEATSKVRDCFPGTPEPQWGSRAGTAVEDVDYLYGNPAASADGSIRCIYVVEPLHRALTLEEAYDFSAALIMPDLQHSVEGKAGRAAAKLRAEDAAREGEQNFAEIRRMVAARTLRLKDEAALKDLAMTIGSVGNLRDCSKVSSLELQERVVIGPATPRNRVVYNDTYQWDDIDPSGNRCIYMKWPLDRGLSADEARDFMDALQLDMGFSPEISREMEAEKVAPSADEKKNSETTIDTATPGIAKLTVSTYPYNTVGAVRYPIGTGDGVNSSAVQLGKYVYYTAAHVVIDPTNQALTGLVVRPALHLPIGFESTPAIPVDAFFESGYTYDPSGVRGHDIAYLRAQKPHPIAAGYAVPIPIYTTRDTGVDSNGTCASAFESSDPYWSDASNSWFNPAGAFGANGCLKNGPERVVVHYPNSVGSVANTHDPYPYISTGTELTGNPNGHASYEMEHRTADTVPVIGMRNAFVSPGSSGGALFAKPYGGSAGDTLLLGIVNNAGPNNVGYAVGKFDTSSFWTSANINYQPPAGVSVSTPAEGGTYDSAHVPNLVASAGSQTSQLRWDSNIDGYLGSGGNVPISGRLSPGFQTITATLGSSFAGLVEQPKSTTTPLKIPHLTITGSTPAPSFIMTPSTVYIPTYRPVGSFSYEWHAPGYPSIDLQNSTNNGAWAPVPALNVPASGADTESITAGTTYKFRFMPHGSTTVLGTVQVTAVVAPTPVFAANPVHMVTNGASANTVVTWSALGYDVIDWCGNTNNQGWQCGSLSTAGSGSVGIPVPVGTTYGYRFYPHGSPNQGGTTQLLGELTVDCVGNTPPTFTANPAHIIVPAGGTDGSTIITWNAPTYSQLDWCGKVDSGPWTWGGLSTPPVGNTKVLVPLGSTYGYRFYGPGGATACSSTTKLGELSVYATH